MVARKPKGKYTYADYAATPDDERWELIDGELYRMAAGASTRHQLVSGTLEDLIKDSVRPSGAGWVLHAPYDVILSDANTVEPDILFVSAARRSIITERACEGAPDLVVEVLSPSNSRRDLEVKRELYARFRVPEYLIVDPYQETVVSLTNPSADEGEGRYANEATYRSGEHLPIGSLPGLVIPVAEIFASPL
jgi:Uma2 family endonuclease